MKKILSIFIFCVCAFSAYANTVTEKDARDIASRFLGNKVRVASADLSLVKVGRQVNEISPLVMSQEPTYFVYNLAGGGFIIIAAEDSVNPVIGYSFEGSFPVENASPELTWWLDDQVNTEVVYARASGKKVAYSSQPVKNTVGDIVVKYETAQWNQTSPYNGESPTIDGHKTLTGCVATAAAIKCRYHKWPYKGSGTVPAYTYNSEDAGHNVTIPANTLGRVYDYDNMPYTYGGGTTGEQREAVAALMYDLGCVSKMMFGWNGSGTYTSTLADGLRTYMHFSSKLNYRYRGSNINSWIADLKKELDNPENGPIVYDGHSNTGGGHCFIFDGYRDDNYFSVNWGWGGSGNGWFRITDANFDYVNGQGAIFNGTPDRAGIYTPDEISKDATLTFDRNTMKMVITNEMDVKFQMASISGDSVAAAVLGKGKSVTVDCSELKGIYNVTMSHVDFPEVVYSLSLEF